MHLGSLKISREKASYVDGARSFNSKILVSRADPLRFLGRMIWELGAVASATSCFINLIKLTSISVTNKTTLAPCAAANIIYSQRNEKKQKRKRKTDNQRDRYERGRQRMLTIRATQQKQSTTRSKYDHVF